METKTNKINNEKIKPITNIIHNDVEQNNNEIRPVTYPIVTSSTYKINIMTKFKLTNFDNKLINFCWCSAFSNINVPLYLAILWMFFFWCLY